MKNQPVLERFFDKVVINENTGCWNFTSSIGKSNCGRFYYNYKCRDAYKIGYLLLGGVIGDKEELHHVCENRLCVNPEHLMPLSRVVHLTEFSPNHISYKNKRKTHCPSGHPYTEDNLVKGDIYGRHCLACAKKRVREFSANKRKILRESGITKDNRLKWNQAQILEMQTSKEPINMIKTKFGISSSRLWFFKKSYSLRSATI